MENLLKVIFHHNCFIFSIFRYNPVDAILDVLPSSVVTLIPTSTLNTLTDTTWFTSTHGNAFLPSYNHST